MTNIFRRIIWHFGERALLPDWRHGVSAAGDESAKKYAKLKQQPHGDREE